MVAFDAKTINELFGLQCFENGEFNRYLDEEVNYTAIIQTLCRNGAEWRMTQDTPVTFKKADMHKHGKRWIDFVAAKLMPSYHTTDITKDLAALIYAIVTEKTIDVGKIIQNGIFRIASGQNSIVLPFTNLIT